LGTQFHKMYFKLAIAEIACLQGEPQSAVDQLHELSFMADTGRSAGIFINYQRVFPNAVNIAQERALLFRRGILPNIDKIPTALLGTRDRLVVNTFGGCKVSYGRQDIGAFQGLDALLITYLAMHPNGVSLEDLRRDVWAAESVEDESITRAMVRLRARLPEKVLTYDNGIYKCQDHTWCDVLEFEQLWDQAHAMPWEDRFSTLRSAAVLYRGAFLNGISNHYWRDEVANKFRKRMGWLKWQLAGLYFRDGQFQEAVTLLEEAMEINPYFSNGMEDLMRVLNHMEEHAQAVHTFNLWAERIKRDLDIEPSDRMGQLKIRIGDAVSDVTRPFAPGALQRAGVRVYTPG
jgi:DNA-binding SARP family transcriptional activator